MSDFNPGEYWEGRLRKSFTSLGVGDDSLGRRYNEWLYRVRQYMFPRLLKKGNIDVRGKTVLDIGSGTGFYIERWKELGAARINGADITHTVVETLSQKHPDVTFTQIDIGSESVPLVGQEFDIVSCFDVLYHIMDDERFARAFHNIYSLVKPGGIFVFSDNFLHGPTVRGGNQVNRSLQEIEALVTGAGFHIQGRYPMFILMAYPIDTRRRFWGLLWRAIFKLGTIHESLGYLFGAILYPVELLCLSIFKESPTSEMMVCRKPEATD